MHCSQCRAEVLINAKFCHKCGYAMEPVSSPATSQPIVVPEPVSLEPANLVPEWVATLWTLRCESTSIAIGVLLLGLYFFMFMCLWFDNFDATIGYTFIFWNCLAFRYYWKRFNHQGWGGILVGIVLSLVFIYLDGLIGGYMRVLSQ